MKEGKNACGAVGNVEDEIPAKLGGTALVTNFESQGRSAQRTDGRLLQAR